MTTPFASHSRIAPPGRTLSPADAAGLVDEAVAPADFQNQRVLIIVPDGTRTAPLGPVFRRLFERIGAVTRAFDVMIALGTHQPMTEDAILQRLEISRAERDSIYRNVQLLNHQWDNTSQLALVGTLSEQDTNEITGGLFSMEVPVHINRAALDYDALFIIGPVFPHEVVGFSGGNKYLFPGIAGPQILNFFHWLGAVLTTPKIIGNAINPVRQVVDRAAALLKKPKFNFALVVEKHGLAGLFFGTPEQAWRSAVELSRQKHIVYKDHPYHTILAQAPVMYDEIWTAGKCMYKLEPVLADGGELIIYAPHITEFSVTHGKHIEEVGYHCRDFFLKQWDKFRDRPWGVLAHGTHVFGLGQYDENVEKPRARVTLATSIPQDRCLTVNLGYRDPASLNPSDFMNREHKGILFVPNAGETLFRLQNPPAWALPDPSPTGQGAP